MDLILTFKRNLEKKIRVFHDIVLFHFTILF